MSHTRFNHSTTTPLSIKIMAMAPAIAIAAAIFYFSSQPADQSTVMSDGVTQMLLRLTGPVVFRMF